MKRYKTALVFGVLCLVCACASNKPENDPNAQKSTGGAGGSGEERGVYVGALSFAGQVNNLTEGLIMLDYSGRDKVSDALSRYTLASKPGTSLYYAVHQALANLKAAENDFPSDVNSINLIIFTDGLDNNSTSLALSPIEDQDYRGLGTNDYRDYVTGEINNRTFANRSITSYAIGIMGNDVDDQTGFSDSLKSLARNPDGGDSNFFLIEDFAESLSKKFQDIADTIVLTNRNIAWNLVTPSFQPGTKIRLTFDVEGLNPSDMAGSKRYIEGEVGVDGSEYVLDAINYSDGITSDAKSEPITGAFDETEVSYQFPNFKVQVNDIKWENTKQWYLEPGASNWRRNSEYNSQNNVKITEERHPTVIYLVLDCSTSLAEADLEAVKNAVEYFIDQLYEKVDTGTGSGFSGKGTLLRNKRWRQDKIEAGEYIYYHFPVSAGEYIVKWNDSLEGDGTQNCDIQVTIYQEDKGESLYFEKDAAYHNPARVSIESDTEILIEVKSYNNGSGTYAIMFEQLTK
ncbi:MAG: hypothetical protein LBG87_04405 [Spirochaetaceae bacterium]|jgi:hypothetical protein|nr:hypothetical protein [Spirochaetaceae bacterium]